jgi:hypothetical protein
MENKERLWGPRTKQFRTSLGLENCSTRLSDIKTGRVGCTAMVGRAPNTDGALSWDEDDHSANGFVLVDISMIARV